MTTMTNLMNLFKYGYFHLNPLLIREVWLHIHYDSDWFIVDCRLRNIVACGNFMESSEEWRTVSGDFTLINERRSFISHWMLFEILLVSLAASSLYFSAELSHCNVGWGSKKLLSCAFGELYHNLCCDCSSKYFFFFCITTFLFSLLHALFH